MRTIAYQHSFDFDELAFRYLKKNAQDIKLNPIPIIRLPIKEIIKDLIDEGIKNPEKIDNFQEAAEYLASDIYENIRTEVIESLENERGLNFKREIQISLNQINKKYFSVIQPFLKEKIKEKIKENPTFETTKSIPAYRKRTTKIILFPKKLDIKYEFPILTITIRGIKKSEKAKRVREPYLKEHAPIEEIKRLKLYNPTKELIETMLDGIEKENEDIFAASIRDAILNNEYDSTTFSRDTLFIKIRKHIPLASLQAIYESILNVPSARNLGVRRFQNYNVKDIIKNIINEEKENIANNLSKIWKEKEQYFIIKNKKYFFKNIRNLDIIFHKDQTYLSNIELELSIPGYSVAPEEIRPEPFYRKPKEEQEQHFVERRYDDNDND